VAVIPTAEDLGTLFRLFGRPDAYARRLAGELPAPLFEARWGMRAYRLLVLMPGHAALNRSDSKEARALRRISVDSGATKDQLARLAIEALSRLSRAAG
jgi:hypothetical protein